MFDVFLEIASLVYEVVYGSFGIRFMACMAWHFLVECFRDVAST